jgi:prepilin-type processing-associated H-X9-DG protein/prepilin-type N-terminal cleavage/methylation domain-containing protein
MRLRRLIRKICPAAFSLTELLVSIAIIGILVGLLVPVVGYVRSTAQATQCASNQRQMYFILMEDIADDGGCLPLAVDYKYTGGRSWIGWKHQQYRIENSGTGDNQGYADVFGCPAQYAKTDRKPQDTYTYSMNLVPTRYIPYNPDKGPIPMTRFTSPPRTVIIADGNVYTDTSYRAGFAYETAKLPEFIHGGQAHFLFLDGHVEALSKEEVPSAGQTDNLSPGSREALFWIGHPW